MGQNEGIFGYESDGKITLKQFTACLLVAVAILVLRHELWWLIKAPFKLLYALAMMPAIAAAGLSIALLILMKLVDWLEEGAQGHLWKERFDQASALALWAGALGLVAGMISHRCLGGTWINIEVGIFAAIVAAIEHVIRKGWVTLPERFQMPDMFDEGYGGALSCLLRQQVEKLTERKE